MKHAPQAKSPFGLLNNSSNRQNSKGQDKQPAMFQAKVLTNYFEDREESIPVWSTSNAIGREGWAKRLSEQQSLLDQATMLDCGFGLLEVMPALLAQPIVSLHRNVKLIEVPVWGFAKISGPWWESKMFIFVASVAILVVGSQENSWD